LGFILRLRKSKPCSLSGSWVLEGVDEVRDWFRGLVDAVGGWDDSRECGWRGNGLSGGVVSS